MPEEGVEELELKPTQEIETKNVTVSKDVYEFHTDEEDEEVVELEAEAEADTSEDEIPIKQIMEMAKKQNNHQAATAVKSGENNVILMFK